MSLRLQLVGLFVLVSGLWTAYAVALGPRIGWVPALLVGLLGALFLLLLISATLETLRGLHKSRLLRIAESGPLRSDGYSAWSGRVVASGEPDRAPLSGVECVLWEYEFEESGSAEPGKWSGIGQAPMAIENTHGQVMVRYLGK